MSLRNRWETEAREKLQSNRGHKTQIGGEAADLPKVSGPSFPGAPSWMPYAHTTVPVMGPPGRGTQSGYSPRAQTAEGNVKKKKKKTNQNQMSLNTPGAVSSL